jgi:endonuclease III
MARLESGSIDWYKYTEKADKIYRKYVEARTEDEKNIWRDQADTLINVMMSKYGNDSNVNYIIDKYYLERL